MTELLNTLYATTPGTSLHLDGDALRVYHPDQTQRRPLLPLIRIDHIVAFRGVNLSDDLLQRCAADGRSVTWLSGSGRFLARVSGPQRGPAALRLAQYQAYTDEPRRVELGKVLVAAKIQNTRQLLLRAGRDVTGHRQTALRDTASALADSIMTLAHTHDLNAILGCEGQAARRYVASWRHLITDHALILAPSQRTSKPPTDPLNAALSFGYGLLRVAVHGAIEQVGLEPYLGFLHGHRGPKPSLALDLMETYRALLVDRFVFTAVNQRQLTLDDFQTTTGGATHLTEAGRKRYFALWSAARSRAWPHATLKASAPAGLLPLLDARILARHLRDDRADFTPWTPL